MKLGKFIGISFVVGLAGLQAMEAPGRKRPAAQELSGAPAQKARRMSTNQMLLEAAKTGNIALAQRALARKGANINGISSADEERHTALHFATENNHEEMTRFLIDKGANVNAQKRGGGTPLHSAAKLGHQAIACALLDRGARINAITSHFKSTPLHVAVSNGQEGMVRLLLDRGAPVNDRDMLGNTALHLIAKSRGPGRDAIARLLLERGAAIEAVDGQLKQTPLASAASHEDEVVVRALLEQGANVNARGPRGETPLTRALWYIDTVWPFRSRNIKEVQERQEPIVHVLMLYGAVPRNQYEAEHVYKILKSRLNPLAYTVIGGTDSDIERELTTYSPENLEQRPLLSEALVIATGHLKLNPIRFLLAKGAEPYQALDILGSLLIRYSVVQAPNRQERQLPDPQVQAFTDRITEVTDALLKSLPSTQEAHDLLARLLTRAALARKKQVVNLLIGYNAPIVQALQALSERLTHVLSFSIRLQLAALGKFLLKRAPLAERILYNPALHTTLQEALDKRQAGGIAPLIAERLAQRAAIEQAARASYFAAVNTGNSVDVRIALAAGIDPNIRDQAGRTALWIAAEQGDKVMMSCLLGQKGIEFNPLNPQKNQRLLDMLDQKPELRNFILETQRNMRSSGSTP